MNKQHDKTITDGIHGFKLSTGQWNSKYPSSHASILINLNIFKPCRSCSVNFSKGQLSRSQTRCMTRSNRENQRNQTHLRPPSKTSGHYQLFCVLCNLCTGAGTGSTWRAFCWTIGQSKHHGFPKTMQITDYQVFPEQDQKVRKPSKQYKRPWTLHATMWSQSASSLYDRMKRRRLQRPWRPRKKPASLGAVAVGEQICL